MAAHITCQNSDILPNTFPPPKPTARSHGMMSEYETPFIIHRSDSVPSRVTGGIDIESDSFPVLRKPIPISGLQNSSHTYDPTLCVTPEKPVRKTSSKNKSLGTATDVKSSSRVRFDQTVEVKQLTPEASEEDVLKSGRSLPRLPSQAPLVHDPDNIPIQTISLHDNIDLDDSNLHIQSKTYQYDVQDDGELIYPRTEVMFEEVEEPVSVTAKDSLSIGIQADKFKQTKSSTQSSDDSESAEELCQIMGEKEHFLARPEFNSTLKFSKELQQLQGAKLDIEAAVEQKLKSSELTKQKIIEQMYSRVNTKWEKKQFSDLISVSVDEEDILEGEGAILKSQKSALNYKCNNEGISEAPEILDFFTMDLQKEAASYSLPGLPNLEEGPQIADLSRSYDIYRHIKAWEKL